MDATRLIELKQQCDDADKLGSCCVISVNELRELIADVERLRREVSHGRDADIDAHRDALGQY